MRHAKIDELYKINSLIENIRKIDNIKEKTPGHFYYKNRNIIHFHIDNSVIYCDIKNKRIKIENNYEKIIDNINDYINEIKLKNSKSK